MTQDKQKQKTERISLLRVFILSELMLAVILAAIFFWCGAMYAKPENAVAKFCEALRVKDWNTVYDLLNVPENSSLSKQMFINARRNDNNTEMYSEVTWELSDREPKLTTYETWYGETPELKAYDSVFTKSDGSGTVDFKINLVKTGKRFWLFDEWKVSPVHYIVKNTGFTVPKGASVTLNGAEVGVDKWAEGSWQSFGIPYLFRGTYQLEVSMDGMETYRNNLRLTKNRQDFTIQLLPDTEIQNAILKQAEEDIERILSAALTDKSFGTVSDVFSTDALKDGSIQSAYNDLRAKASIGEEGVTWLEITNMKGILTARENAYNTNEENDMIVSLSGHVNEKYIYLSEQTNSLVNDAREFEIEIKAVYTRINGLWKLISLPVTADMI
ncbi:MAG: hypothetical protein Q4E89_09365 [Eubacteriales bacterium]|nr:hypothetical protein [Eubacteriales bacterium]